MIGNNSTGSNRRVITVAGCKGGVGKSVLSSAIALELGRLGNHVVLVDADLGGPNLHTYLGIQAPRFVISDFLGRRVPTIEDIALETDFPGVRFVSSAGNVPSQANPKFAQKAKIIKGVLSLAADYIVIDIGAGSSNDVMDFFSITHNGILVTVPEPTSIVNSYGFMKNVLFRRFTMEFRQYSLVMELLKRGMNPDGDGGISGIQELMKELATVNSECWIKAKSMLSSFAPNIIVNMTTSDSDVKLGHKLKAIIGKYLSIDALYLGQVEDDPAIKMSARKMIPFSVLAPESKAAASVKSIVRSLLRSPSGQSRSEISSVEAQVASGQP